MNNTFDDLSPELQEHCQDVLAIAMALMPFHEKREETYNLSFAKRGESGVWMNLMRKTDRLDRLSNKVFSGEEGNNGVTLVDTLVDTAMYALKWLAVIKQIRPDDMEMWIATVFCKETGIEMKQAMEMFGMLDDVTAEMLKNSPYFVAPQYAEIMAEATGTLAPVPYRDIDGNIRYKRLKNIDED